MKRLLVLGALLVATMRASAETPTPANVPPPEGTIHTMTIYKENRAIRLTWVWENGAWHEVCPAIPCSETSAPPCLVASPRCETPAPRCRTEIVSQHRRMTWVWENGEWRLVCVPASPRCEPPAPRCPPEFAPHYRR
jgi:hypothetical protein